MDFDSTAWQHIDALQIGRQSIKLLVTALIGKIRKTILILGVVIAVLAVSILPTILVNNDPAAEKNAATLNRGLIGDAESLDPHEFSTKQAGDVLRDIGEGLVTYSADGKLASVVA
ncbi:MAG: hypothetical protein HKN77_07265, partial [Woeseiaceae bacterium]|nr:hypothetical protein [Woeseiaceae bacterium]